MDTIPHTMSFPATLEGAGEARQSIKVLRPLPFQQAQVAAVATRAFFDDAVYTYIFPNAEERERCLGRYMEAFFAFARIYGETYAAPNLEGVACWLSPWKAKPVLWQVVRTGFALPRATLACPKEARNRMAALAGYLNNAHQRAVKGRHWQLAVLAVDPAHQRQGFGGRLIEPGLDRADAENLPCYLDTQSEQNVRFYEKFGFVVASAGEVPGHPMRIWAMVRQPRR